jgi:tetratricopeptide (TPR) repeat protein
MLDGEIEYRRQNYDKAFEHLRESIELDDKLPYSEPWSWMQPSRHAYAALLLEQGHLEEAAKVYRADLGLDSTLIRPRRHPNNVWSLQGYHECLTRLGRTEEAAVIEPAVKLALAVADIPIKSSCFCRLDTSQAPRVIKGCSFNGNCH